MLIKFLLFYLLIIIYFQNVFNLFIMINLFMNHYNFIFILLFDFRFKFKEINLFCFNIHLLLTMITHFIKI